MLPGTELESGMNIAEPGARTTLKRGISAFRAFLSSPTLIPAKQAIGSKFIRYPLKLIAKILQCHNPAKM
jgi:hypothetical protein